MTYSFLFSAVHRGLRTRFMFFVSHTDPLEASNIYSYSMQTNTGEEELFGLTGIIIDLNRDEI